jgi:hypothetical protein
VFLFDNAKKDPKSTTEKGERYLIVAATEDLPLRANLNHEVQMTARSRRNRHCRRTEADRKDLPTFSSRSVTSVSDTCGMVAR